MASADFGYYVLCIHIANKNFMNVFVWTYTKSHIPGSYFRKSGWFGCRLKNFRAYLCCLR